MHKDARETVTHDEMLFSLAVAVGKATKADDPAKAAEAALMLGELITEEDIARCKGILKASMEACGCETCVKVLARIAELEAEQSGESFAV